ncbi:peptidase family M1-domain-containing protein [Dissophora ornata]|nr:peptidase family M1-domain-containing protein [Dissophora ornata]
MPVICTKSVNVHEPTSEIKVNAKKLNISKTSVTVSREAYKAAAIECTSDQVATFTFAQQIPVGPAVPEIEFEGEHNDHMDGFYRSLLRHTRQTFPCWDHPAVKATFSVVSVVPFAMQALSNMPVKEITAVENDIKTVYFERLSIMSTYEDDLEITPKTLEYFTKIFGTEYPLPKLDHIVIPDFDMGAMENWGLITYRTVALLYDENTSATSNKEGVVYTVAHEIAHQWFGNLVTMEWWEHLWLNEGFATWVGTLAVDHVFPSWGFVINEYQQGLSLDCLRSSHPIEVPVSDPHEIGSICHPHVDQLADLKKNEYKNASTDDLWSALSEEFGIEVGEFMNTWTRIIGILILNVTEDSGIASVEQRRFLSTNDVTHEEDKTIWRVPLGVHPRPDPIVDHNQTMKTRILKLKTPQSKDGANFYMINKNFTGVFRASYPPSAVRQLGLAIQEGHHDLGVTERGSLLAEQASLATAVLSASWI